jgi:hypothetical protein
LLIMRPREPDYYHAWHPRAEWFCDSQANRTHCLLHRGDDERFLLPPPTETRNATADAIAAAEEDELVQEGSLAPALSKALAQMRRQQKKAP